MPAARGALALRCGPGERVDDRPALPGGPKQRLAPEAGACGTGRFHIACEPPGGPVFTAPSRGVTRVRVSQRRWCGCVRRCVRADVRCVSQPSMGWGRRARSPPTTSTVHGRGAVACPGLDLLLGAVAVHVLLQTAGWWRMGKPILKAEDVLAVAADDDHLCCQLRLHAHDASAYRRNRSPDAAESGSCQVRASPYRA